MKTKIQSLLSDSKFIANAKDIIAILGFLLSVAWNTNCFGQDTLYMYDGKKIAGQVLEISSIEIRYKKIENTDGPLYISLKKEVDKIKYKNGTIESFEYQKPWLVPDEPKAPEQQKTDPVKQAEIVVPPVKEAVIKKKIVQPTFLTNTSNDYVNTKKQGELRKIGSRFMIGNNIVTENQMYISLLNMNDPKITNEIIAAKHCRNRQYIGFVAFPFLFGGLAALSSGQDNETGGALLGLSAVCFGTSIYLKDRRNYHQKEIMKLYNQLN